MLRSAWFIASKDVQYVLRERETILWLFIMPLVFFFFVGTITRGFGGGGDVKQRLAVTKPDDGGFLADELLRRLDAQGFEIVEPTTLDEFNSSSRRLTIPPGFSQSVLAGDKATIEFRRKEKGVGRQYDELRVRRAAYTVLADLAATTSMGQEPSEETFRKLAEMPRAITLDVQSGGERRKIPTGFEQAIPGTMVMFTLIVLLTSGTVTLVVDRRLGVTRRLASTPIAPGAIVLGKWGGRLALGFVQIAFAMIAGTLLFGLDWGPSLPMVLLVLVGWGGLCASAALLLGNIVRSEGQAIAVGVLASNALAALGGCWWPIEITPAWMQNLAKLLPTGWTMDAMHKLVSFQAGWSSALPHLAILLAATAILGWLAARRYRFQ